MWDHQTGVALEAGVVRASRRGPSAVLARAYPALAALLIAAALGLRWTCLHTGFMVDDYLQLAMIERAYPAPRGPFDLYTFATGDRAENDVLRAHGLLTWWSHPELRISMFRPLSCALTWFDRAVFGLNAFAHHLHSAAWWLLMCGAMAALLRRVLPVALALLALLLFLADEGHTSMLNWLAMRNATVASAFALGGLWAQVRARQDGWRPGRPLALGCYAVALAAGEYALAFAGYALLYELQQPATRAERVRQLWLPVGVLLAGYFGLRALAGAGASASGMYLHPLSAPAAFAGVGFVRLTVLVADLLAGLPAMFFTWGPPWSPADFPPDSPILPFVLDLTGTRILHHWFGIACVVVAFFVARACLRAAAARGLRDVRWLVLGVPLAIVPVLGSFPESRLLIPALVGFCVVPALLLHARLQDARSRDRGRVRAWLAAALAGGFVVYHLALPIARAPADAEVALRIASAARRAVLDPALDPILKPGQRVLLLGGADGTTTLYGALVRRVHGRPAPSEWHLVASTFAPQSFERLSATAFALERMHPGFTAGDTYAEFFTHLPLRGGDQFQAGNLRVTVERAEHGRPIRTRYELDVPLEDPSLVFLIQTIHGLVRFPLPSPGQTAIVPPPHWAFEHP